MFERIVDYIEDHDWIAHVGIAIATLAVIFGFTFVLCLGIANSEIKEWNDGVCTKCEIGTYEYSEAVGHKYASTYIYQYDNCNHRIEISNLR